MKYGKECLRKTVEIGTFLQPLDSIFIVRFEKGLEVSKNIKIQKLGGDLGVGYTVKPPYSGHPI